MKFMNYINRRNGLGRIYSEEDLLKMMLGELLDNEEIILAQNERIGIPKASELEESPNTEWIAPYTNREGNPAGGYWQSIFNPYERPYDESFMPKNRITKINDWVQQYKPNMLNGITGDIEQPLYEENEEGLDYMQSPLLEGSVEYNQTLGDKIKNDIGNKIDELKDKVKNTTDKYEGLDPVTAAQKAASKVSPAVYADYYGLSSRFNDKDEIPDRILKENDIYTLEDIKDKQLYDIYAADIAKNKGLDINNPEVIEQIKNTKIVTPNEESRLYKSIKNTETFDKWISENYEKIKKGDGSYQQSIEFPLSDTIGKGKYSRNAVGTIHKADMKDARINEDGSMSVNLRDWYNFEKWKYRNLDLQNDKDKTIKDVLYNGVVFVNNRAYDQQTLEQLENYLINMPINISKEELEKILKRYRY